MAQKPSGSKSFFSNLSNRRRGQSGEAPSSSSMVPVQLELFIFIIGLDASFPVTIESSKTVGNLKERIWEKNPNELKGVDADRLSLYRVDFSDFETLAQSAVQAAEKNEPLRPFTPLSEIFSVNPPAKTINIVVEVVRVEPLGE